MNRNQLAGIEIGGTKLQVAVSNEAGTITSRFRYAIDAAAGAAGIQHQLETCLAEIKPQTLAAIGVGFGGPVDWKRGVIQTSHQVSGWAGFDLKGWLQLRTGARVVIDNDANVAALAEAVHGAGKSYDLVFYMTIGSGIGGGLVVQKKIYHGTIPGEVEIGHIRLDKSGTTLESACSGWAINKKIRTHIEAEPTSLLAQLATTQTGHESALLQPALHQNDVAATQILHDIADDLAFALSHVVHLFHPAILVIGGGVSLLGAPLQQRVAERLPNYVMTAFHPVPEVALAACGEDVVPIGALELAQTLIHETQQSK